MIRRLALVAALFATSAVGLVVPTARAADADVEWITQELRPKTKELGLGVAVAPNGSAVYSLVQRETSVELVKRRPSNGAQVWQRTVESKRSSIGLAVTTASNGDIVVLSASPTSVSYMFTVNVSRWTAAGAEKWSTPVVTAIYPAQGQLTIGPDIYWALRGNSSPSTQIHAGAVAMNGTARWDREYNSEWNDRVFDLLWTRSTGLLMVGDSETARGPNGTGVDGDAFVWYLDTSDGKVVDLNRFTRDGFMAGQSVAVGPDGTVYVVVVEKTGTQTAEIWTVHRDSSRDRRVMTFTADELLLSVSGMFVDKSGFVFVGNARGRVEGATTSFGNDDVYVMRTNKAGTRRSTVMLGTPSIEVMTQAARLGNSLFISGFTAGRLPTGTGRPAATVHDSFVVSLTVPTLPR